MKNAAYIFLLLFLVEFAFAGTQTIVTADLLDGAYAPKNYVKNGEFEKNKLNVTDASTIATRSTTSPISGDASLAIDATASAQIVALPFKAFGNDLKNSACFARFFVSGDASLYKTYVKIGSVQVTSDYQLGNYPDARKVSVYFPCGDLTNTGSLVIESTGNGAAIKIDKVYAGESIGPVDMSTGWQIAGESSFRNFSATSDCYITSATPGYCGTNAVIPGPTILDQRIGTWGTTDVDAFKQTITNLPAGTYRIMSEFPIYITSNGGNCQVGWTDGNGNYSMSNMATVTGNGSSGHMNIVGTFTYTTPQASVTFGPAVKLCGGALTTIYPSDSTGSNGAELRFHLDYQAPVTNVVKFDQLDSEWIDCTISITTQVPSPPTLPASTTNLCKYRKRGKVMDWMWNFVGNGITGGTNGSGGYLFNIPGGYEVDTTVIKTNGGAGGNIDCITGQLPGHARFGNNTTGVPLSPMLYSSTQVAFCQIDAVQNVLFNSGNNIFSSASAVFTMFVSSIPIKGWTSGGGVAVSGLVGSSSPGAVRHEFITFGGSTVDTACTSSPCTVYSQSGIATGVTRTGAGIYSVNFPAGTWSSKPACTAVANTGGGIMVRDNLVVSPWTAYTFKTYNGASDVDSSVMVLCSGAR